MQSHHLKMVSIGIGLCLAFALGVALQSVTPFARPTAAQGIVVDGNVALSEPAAPAAPAGNVERVTYQGRLTTSSGTPINTPVNIVFNLYDVFSTTLWTSSPTRTVTPANGLFTVYLGDGADPQLFNDTLVQAVSIGVKVGSDLEMNPRQSLNSVVGHSANDVGVVGSSGSWIGVRGTNNTGFGVYGTSNQGIGVVGIAGVTNTAGVVAQAANDSGIALAIQTGGIQVKNASGMDSSTFAFVHRSTLLNIFAHTTRISNTLTNGDPNAMLFVTHVANPTGLGSSTFFNRAFGVFYDTGASQWAIYAEDNAAFDIDIAFNVMVIKR